MRVGRDGRVAGWLRLALAGLLGAAVPVAAGPAAPASAHAAHAPAATNFRTEIVSVEPTVAGLSVTTIEATTGLRLTNRTGRPLRVLGYSDEPFLEIRPDGVYENVDSPATYLNQDRGGELASVAPVDPEQPPTWRQISDTPVASWYDHRTHWMGLELPPAVAADPGSPRQIRDWVVLVRDGETTVEIRGTLSWEPPPSAAPWWVAIAAAAALIMLAGLIGGRPARLVPPAALAVAALATLGYAVARELDAGTTGVAETVVWLATGQLLPVLCALASLAIVAVAFRRRALARPGGGLDLLVALAGATLAVVAGLANAEVFGASVAPVPAASGWARAAVAAVIAGGGGAAAACAWAIHRATRPRHPAAPGWRAGTAAGAVASDGHAYPT